MNSIWETTKFLIEKGHLAAAEPAEPAAEPEGRSRLCLLPYTVVLRRPCEQVEYETVLVWAQTWHEAVQLVLDDKQDHDVCAVFAGHHSDVWNEGAAQA
ncbi:hypothetical protein OOT46_17915 [Aquabacterium sp. A7-Y]|uniref:hypothetical protein n=1 Tax=Aquabacterium sp. A7-Y TaxID=1349605 RepID=UPI00223D0E41|nr:hypothetical protein [Aquabacterium sp. A7-Y]MCW7539718.1 hypothetical protein [Aquabacterium sp. A7-Y]